MNSPMLALAFQLIFKIVKLIKDRGVDNAI
jgi:hypothetical protein